MNTQGKKKVIIIGCGNRGTTYTKKMLKEHPDAFEVVAVAEPIDNRRNHIRDMCSIPEEMCFKTWEPLLEMDKIADVAVIATMDRGHFAPAIAAIKKGYNLLLEKPISPTPDECKQIELAAKEKGVFVLVCHVLRYTKFFNALKYIIDSGKIGKIMNVIHCEGVGNVHQSHSFVRGNWCNSEESSFMLLQKSCHDMDILAWLIGKPCTKVQSFGTLSYFCSENAPKGAPERCIDGCPIESTCPYNSVNLYLKSTSAWLRGTSTRKSDPTDEDVLKALKTTQYGKCVYKCSNNVVDHQVVNLQFGDDIFVSFTMSAFNKGGRTIRIMGTTGEITAKMDGNEVFVTDFVTKKTTQFDCDGCGDETINSGHGGGDSGIIFALKELLNGNNVTGVCDISESCFSHMIAFAAEESRLSGGKLIVMDDYLRSHNII